MLNSGRVRAVLIPAAVFQSVMFGGAYGTGREVAEFVSRHGPVGGLFALAQIGVTFALVLTLCFEIARVFSAYDYRTFFRALIGRAWFVFEILFIVSMPLVLAVNAAAAGTIMSDQFHLPAFSGVAITFAAVVAISYLGRQAVQQSLTYVSVGLVLVLSITAVVTVGEGAQNIRDAFTSFDTIDGWPISALQYSLYNVAVIPVILYSARDIKSPGQSVTCGFIGGIAGVFPAAVFHVAFMVSYPDILQDPLPVYSILKSLASPALFWTYIVILIFMIMSTVAGLLHGLNERLDVWHTEVFGRRLRPIARASYAALVMVISMALSGIGITALIAKGYGTLAWAFLLVFVLPLLIVAPVLIYRHSRQTADSAIR